MKRHWPLAVSLLMVLATGSPAPAAENETRGVGVYPGDPHEDFAPVLVLDTTTYRNLALRRPAFQSSAYDYNLTAQLVTDGVRETIRTEIEARDARGEEPRIVVGGFNVASRP